MDSVNERSQITHPALLISPLHTSNVFAITKQQMMNHTLTEARPQYLVNAPRLEMSLGITALLIIGAGVLLALNQLNPPPAADANAPSSEFSSARAFKHLAVIAERPRPIGSAAHTEARDYLVRELSALGLITEVQKATGVNRMIGATINAATVENVLARLKGTVGGPAVLLVCHYDSVPTGPGASDDGSAVVALLETARALKSQPPLRNDVIFLFTDAEETGLLGAKAFVDEHEWAKEIGIVLNFEARGHTGQSIMFETSPNNRWLIAQFAAAAQYPVGNSLSYEVYKRLPNDTDFTIFKGQGFNGLNFAYLEGLTHYHTHLDNLKNLDQRSLQHDGSYALSLARHFGNLDLSQNHSAGDGTAANAVYFNILGFSFVHYSDRWVLLLLCVTLLLFVGVTYLGWRSKQLTLVGSAAGFVAFLGAVALTPLLLWAVWWLLRLLQRVLRIDEQSVAYQQNLYLLGFVALSIATAAALFVFLRRRISAPHMVFGALLWWAMFAILTSVVLPGASYVFIWPLLFSLVAMAFLFSRERWESSLRAPFIVLTLCALPGIVLLTPTIYLLFAAMGLGALVPVVVLVVMLVGLLIPQLRIVTATRSWFFPAIAAVTGLVLLSTGSLTQRFDESHPRSVNIFYALDADAHQAIWASADPTPDKWIMQYLTTARRGAISEYIPQKSNNFFSQTAPTLALSPPQVELLSDTTSAEIRTLKLRITSPRKAQVITVYMESDTSVQTASLNGKQLDDNGAKGGHDNSQTQWRMSYFAPPTDGIELTLGVKPSLPVKLRVMDRSYGLAEIPGSSRAERPTWLMPSARLLYSDQTLVNRTYSF